jgi:formylglycine-generating enzyme required for sulfatase activity
MAGIDATAWHRGNSRVKEPGQRDEPPVFSNPRPVGTKGANLLGLYDLQGNVWEWCSSLLLPYPYNPADGREDLSAKGLRVLRGGSFADRPDVLNPALRHAVRPDRRLRSNGFRLARSVP